MRKIAQLFKRDKSSKEDSWATPPRYESVSRTVRVRMTRSTTRSSDGIRVEHFESGKAYLDSESSAIAFKETGAAGRV